MRNNQELNVWQQGIELVKIVYLVTKSFPHEERYGLTSQMTRAAVSIPANIAEGSSRNSDKDNARFIQIALGSAFELQTFVVIARHMGWAQTDKLNDLDLMLEQEIKMLYSFLRKLGEV